MKGAWSGAGGGRQAISGDAPPPPNPREETDPRSPFAPPHGRPHLSPFRRANDPPPHSEGATTALATHVTPRRTHRLGADVPARPSAARKLDPQRPEITDNGQLERPTSRNPPTRANKLSRLSIPSSSPTPPDSICQKRGLFTNISQSFQRMAHTSPAFRRSAFQSSFESASAKFLNWRGSSRWFSLLLLLWRQSSARWVCPLIGLIFFCFVSFSLPLLEN